MRKLQWYLSIEDQHKTIVLVKNVENQFFTSDATLEEKAC